MEVLNLGIIQIYTKDTEIFTHFYPSIKIGGTWQDTDVSSETSEVQSLCNNTWTDEVKIEYQSHIDENLVE
tara:strand:- start:50 stop:262 length:213 start_codon:yes stop_codon:yes gene_type:complete